MLRTPPAGTPLRAALVVGGSYLIVAVAYIFVSSEAAASSARSLADLRHVELLKGLGFVTASALLMATVTYVLIRRVAANRERLLEAREALAASDRQALPGLLAASVAHDFANVLTSVSGSAQLLTLDTTLSESARKRVKAIEDGVRRAVDLARRLGHVGKGAAAGEVAELQVDAIALEMAGLLHSHPAVRRTTVRVLVVGDAPVRLRGYQVPVGQVLTNLIINAAEAPGTDRIAVFVAPLEDGCRISVHDNGPGIDPAIAARAGEAFFTTKATGTGLGLVSVRACAEMHGGDVTIGSSPSGGARVDVTLHHVGTTEHELTHFRRVHAIALADHG